MPLSVAEVDRVAEECGRWAPLVVFMADSGARPAEALALEWRHVNLDRGTVELPGAKTELAWRTVHLTSRGVAALRSMPRALQTRHVFHVEGRPISWRYFSQDVWHPALTLAGLEPRAPYNLRHSYAWHCLQAGVPIATQPARWDTPTCLGRSPSTAVGATRWARTPRRCEKHGLAALTRH